MRHIGKEVMQPHDAFARIVEIFLDLALQIPAGFTRDFPEKKF